jgi:hypothetical protein
MLKNKNTLFWIILLSFLLIPLIVSIISSIHVINFFELSNNKALAIALSVSFEIGALSALAGLVVMDKINKNVIYFIFILLTAYQMMGNTYFAYDILSQKMEVNPNLINNWTELFGFETDDTVLMKRIIAIISGAILPIVSLCFLDLSVDYIKKSSNFVEEGLDKKKVLTEVSSPLVEKITTEVNTEEELVEPTPIISREKIEVITEEEKKMIREEVDDTTTDPIEPVVVEQRPKRNSVIIPSVDPHKVSYKG